MDLISVIVPVYNAGKYLPNCLDSLISQTYRNLEILLIDDGSSDDSGQVCDMYAARDPRVQVFHKPNGGVSSARNLGLEKAQGQWISFVDSDDYLEPKAYEVLIQKTLEAKCDIITFEYYIEYPDKSIRHRTRDQWYRLLNRVQAVEHNLRVNSFPVTRIFRSGLVNGEGKIPPLRFDETIARGEDGLFNTQLIHRAEAVLVVSDALYHYVQSEESACRGKFRVSQLTALRLKDFYEPFLSENYPELLQPWYMNFMELLIMLYDDMHRDEADHRDNKRLVYQTYLEVYRHAEKKNTSLKKKMKLGLFRASPWAFCIVHKLIWRGAL